MDVFDAYFNLHDDVNLNNVVGLTHQFYYPSNRIDVEVIGSRLFVINYAIRYNTSNKLDYKTHNMTQDEYVHIKKLLIRLHHKIQVNTSFLEADNHMSRTTGWVTMTGEIIVGNTLNSTTLLNTQRCYQCYDVIYKSHVCCPCGLVIYCNQKCLDMDRQDHETYCPDQYKNIIDSLLEPTFGSNDDQKRKVNIYLAGELYHSGTFRCSKSDRIGYIPYQHKVDPFNNCSS